MPRARSWIGVVDDGQPEGGKGGKSVLGIERRRGYALRRDPFNFVGSATWARIGNAMPLADLAVKSIEWARLAFEGGGPPV